MADTPTAEQLEVRRRGRQRLIGAVAIVLLAVVFVPMVLDPEPRSERKEPSVAIPSQQAAAPLPMPVPAARAPEKAPELVAPPKSVPPKAAEFKSAAVKPAEAPKPAAPAPVPVATPTPTPTPAKVPTVAPKLEGFAVQVGAFGDDAKLAEARAKLQAAKIAFFTEYLESRKVTRVRAGPYATREAAEKAVPTVKAAGLDAQVVPLP